ncbi:MAG: hypothetical protein JNK65_06470, partial [Deltaproteobacteria bacterium]|nr:hypothetical protein [Deltaproteobacteria bacterium]
MFFSRSKFWIASILIVGFFAVVISRLFYLQVVRGKNYSQFSDQFAIKEIPLKAPRGNILDRKGRKIASTRPSFHLFLYPQKVKNLSVFIPLVAEKLSLSVEEIQAPIDAAKGQARFRPITLKTDLNRDQIARIQMAQSMTHGSIDEMDLNWSALQVKVEPVRQYEGGEMWGHAIGYLREVSEEKLKNLSEQYPGHY